MSDKYMGYCWSKLANILHAKELARRLETSKAGISVYAVNPGSYLLRFGFNEISS
jgi:NAD(P)-dependent dehydrogenase (short-subunit alcohol dehydrogenase family)